MNKFIVLAVLVIVSACAAAQAPVYRSPSTSGSNGYGGNQQEEPARKPHKFEYAVKDEKSGNDYGHKEESDGKVVTGMYRVALPDGRVQVVTYRADENGYVADVKYEGEAKYPEPSPAAYKPSGSSSRPSY